MEFVIQCTTCRARLKIHDSALVGTIIECVKCGSFVEVIAPPGWQPNAASAAQAPGSAPASFKTSSWSESLAPKTFSNVDPRSAKSPSGSGAPPPLPGKSAAASGSNNLPKSTTPKGAASSGVAKSVVSAAASSELVKSAALAKPTSKSAPTVKPVVTKPAATKSGSVEKLSGSSSLIVPDLPKEPGLLSRLAEKLPPLSRQTWLITGGGALLFLVAVALTWWLWGGGHSKTVLKLEEPGAALVGLAPPEAHTPESEPLVNALPVTEAQPSEEPAADETQVTEPAADAHADEAGSTKETSEHTPSADSLAKEPEPGAAAATENPEQKTAAQPTAPTKILSSDDPLDSVAHALAQESDPLGDINPGVPASPSRGASSTGSASPDQEPAANAKELAAQRKKQAALVAHLQDKLPEVDFNNVTLGQYVSFLSQFSTVPIVIDSESLLEVGKGAKTRVTVKLSNVTVAEALKAALAKPGLSYRVETGRVVVVAGSNQK